MGAPANPRIERMPSDATKVCRVCGTEKQHREFARDRSRRDGLTYWCRDCRNARSRLNHISRATGSTPGPDPAPARDGDARQARRRVNVLVRTGRLAHPNTLPCADCGHDWSSGERRHEYDHHRGYAAEHHLDVEAVCTTCHHQREANRDG